MLSLVGTGLNLGLVALGTQDDPPRMVRADAGAMDARLATEPATETSQHPPGFMSAARKEHREEAAAMKQLLTAQASALLARVDTFAYSLVLLLFLLLLVVVVGLVVVVLSPS
jgi:hypothetical protein